MSIKKKFYVFWKKATDQIAPGSRSNSWKIFQMCQNQRHLFILQKLWLHWSINKIIPVSIVLIFFPSRNHPFKMSAFFRREGSKIGQICCPIIVKNCQEEGGREQKSWKFADILNDGPLEVLKCTKISFVKVRFIFFLKYTTYVLRKGFGHAVI